MFRTGSLRTSVGRFLSGLVSGEVFLGTLLRSRADHGLGSSSGELHITLLHEQLYQILSIIVLVYDTVE